MIDIKGARPPQAASTETSAHAPHAALLVDFDNVTMGIRSDLQNQLRKLLNSDIIRGKVSVQRAYADWRRYPQYIVPLSEASIDLIFAPAVGANKKNATDIRLAIDALELVFTRPEIGTYILLSGDSDFSALVLKLKEYGKYVIGVGIRESSSDLLVQNCDEYYSYNELTGLSLEGAVEHVRRDPWELVVEAAQKMQRDGDVMRSDRLKQVMQSIDPNFDERDSGFNRFSKFVVDAAQRGLLRLTKMENGQYAVELGPNANVPEEARKPAEEQQAEAAERAAPAGRKRSPRAKGARQARPDHLTLSESFDLLRRALLAVGAVGAEATGSEKAREQMKELAGGDSDPVFEGRRFVRLLRQAHDAGLIELIKSGDEDYELKLSTAHAEEEEAADDSQRAEVAPVSEEASALVSEEPDAEEVAAKPKRTTKRKKTSVRKSSRSKARASAKEAGDEEEAAAGESRAAPDEDQVPSEEATAKPELSTRRATKRTRTSSKKKVVASDKGTADIGREQPATAEDSAAETDTDKPKRGARRARKRTTKSSRSKARVSAKEAGGGEQEPAPGGGDAAVSQAEVNADVEVPAALVSRRTARRNPRFRRGSRGGGRAPADPAEAPRTDDVKAEPASWLGAAAERPQSLGMRAGSRGAVRPAQGTPAVAETPAVEAAGSVFREERESPPRRPPDHVSPPAAEKQGAQGGGEGGGLFRRVTAALQRAVGSKTEDQGGE